jgi:hypothetical protein
MMVAELVGWLASAAGLVSRWLAVRSGYQI